MGELPRAVEERIVRVASHLLLALRDVGGGDCTHLGPDPQATVMSLVRLLVSMPFDPAVAWRVYMLTSTVLLLLHPSSTVKKGGALQELPGPDRAARLPI